MKVGYVVASNEVAVLKKPIGYFYREEPMDAQDSGWRFFTGEESEEYMGDAKNLAMYNATTIVSLDPSVAAYLGHDYPVAFERDERSGEFVQIQED